MKMFGTIRFFAEKFFGVNVWLRVHLYTDHEGFWRSDVQRGIVNASSTRRISDPGAPGRRHLAPIIIIQKQAWLDNLTRPRSMAWRMYNMISS